jgi:hypothetical protein
MSNIFLATSPLHVIISTLIASSMKRVECHLILCGKEKERIKLFHTLLHQWPQSPFSSIIALEHAKRPSNFIHTLNTIKPSEVIVGNDLVPEFFAIAHLSVKYNFKLSYMDDGLHSYIEYIKDLPFPIIHEIKNLGRRLIKGYTKPFPHTIGSSPLTTSAYLFYPEFSKELVAKKKCYKISINEASKSSLASLGEHCINNWDISLPATNIALFVLPHYSRMSESIKFEFITSITSFYNDGVFPIIKNHPSNDDSYIEDILGGIPKNIAIEVPKTLPIEILICARPPAFIMGGLSSIFLSTKALARDTKFKLVGDDQHLIPSNLSTLFNLDNKAFQ